ncbi:MAG: MFS transporter, partial [Candidatus Marinimicrobia bacterium]|nr:MFS transporter [Candidatus Neomarinimicrobiota bacterium]
IYFALSAAPEDDKPVNMTFGKKKGSQDIYLANTGIFEFTSENWNIPQKATLKVKHNLQTRASARFDAQAGDVPFAWSISIGFLGLLFLIFAFYHKYMLPKPIEDESTDDNQEHDSYFEVFASFFRKKEIIASIAFLLLYRFSESQLTKMASPFLLDAREAGGLALSLTEKGFAYGTIGLVALLTGGILGGIIASRDGLKKWIWWMAIAINVPNTVYIFLSYVMPDSRVLIFSCIAIEQLGYGFGFTGYMLYMLYIAGQGRHKTAHYAITTGFMALGMMIPGMISGAMQELLGYQHFFIYVILCTIPSFLALSFINVDANFGKKSKLKSA